MTKVKVDVQLVITGGVGDGKSEITHRILKAIKADHGLQSICKLNPARSFEAIRCEHTGLSFQGELLKNGEMETAPSIYSDIPGYPDTEKMLNHLLKLLQRSKVLLNSAYGISEKLAEPQVKSHPRDIWLDDKGVLHAFGGNDRVLMGQLLMVEPATPQSDDSDDSVGMPAPAASEAASPIRDSETDHIPSMLPGPDDDCDSLALRRLQSFIHGFASKFKKHSCVEGSIVKGNYWGIFSDGAFLPIEDFIHSNKLHARLVYIAEREVDQPQPTMPTLKRQEWLAAWDTLRKFETDVQDKFKKHIPDVMPEELRGVDCVIQTINRNGDVHEFHPRHYDWSHVAYWRVL